MTNILVIFAVSILGWICGFAVNYVSDVLPARRKLVLPICLSCGEKQPIINYLFWPRRCPHCQYPRSRRTWVVEILFALSAAWIWVNPPDELGFWLGLVVLVYFGIVVVIDMEHRLILHVVSLAGAILALIIGISLHGYKETLFSGLVGFGLMFILYLFGILFARWASRRRGQAMDEEALGFGDVTLSGVLGLLLGFPEVIRWLVISIFIGAVVSMAYLVIMLSARKYRLFSPIPYGPSLIAGAIYLLYIR